MRINMWLEGWEASGNSYYLDYFKPSCDAPLEGGDVSFNYEGVCDDFFNFKMMCWISLLEVLIG